MAKDSILIGGDIEASCKITFNPKTFELTFGDRHGWTALPATDSYYILGTISGHWQDGEIKEEKAKMRMQGYESGNLRYYTWFPPEGEEVETGMWGSTAAGTFQPEKTDLYYGTEIKLQAVLHTMPVKVSRLLRVVPLRFVFISKKMNALKLLL